MKIADAAELALNFLGSKVEEAAAMRKTCPKTAVSAWSRHYTDTDASRHRYCLVLLA
jgi:hypothetical protein